MSDLKTQTTLLWRLGVVIFGLWLTNVLAAVHDLPNAVVNVGAFALILMFASVLLVGFKRPFDWVLDRVSRAL